MGRLGAPRQVPSVEGKDFEVCRLRRKALLFVGWERVGEVGGGFRSLSTSRDFFGRYKKVVCFGFLTLWWIMIEEIIKEKTSADHLMYVSLKYTKTCDVILNLLARWKSLIEISFDAILEKRVEEGKIPAMPTNPKQRIEFVKKFFRKTDTIQEVIPLYVFFKRIPDLKKTREGEFRKNVNLKVFEASRVTEINMEKLGEYYEIVEKFIGEVKGILS